MKHLTINQIARANLRHNRRAYLSMAVGIFMAVFLAATLCLCVQGIVARQAEDRANRFGCADIYTTGGQTMNDSEMLETGFFQPEIGHVYVNASVPETTITLGYYDEAAVPLMHRRVLEGRMPEAPGEIAIEKSVLDRLRVENMGVGDTLTLTVEPVYGLPEERAYTIVGFLNEQSSNLNARASGHFVGEFWPAILTCPEEPGFASGGMFTLRLFTLRPFVTRHQVLSAFGWDGTYHESVYAVLDSYWGTRLENDAYFASPMFLLQRLIEGLVIPLVCMLGAALLIAVCTGISGAMESQLAHKTEEIGMLRAVGATKRQIRRIFGREAWLLALTVSPAAILLSCLTVWGLSLIAPSHILFRPSLWVLLPVLLLVTVTIFVSSSLPLRRASRIMPMSVLRDTAILRKARRIKSRKRFKVPALVARRQLTLHPTRLIGSVVLVAMMLFIAFFGTMVAGVNVTAYMDSSPAFRLGSDSYVIHFFDISFIDVIPPQMVLSSDLDQIASLPGVSKVLTRRSLHVCFEADELSDYYSYPHGSWGRLNQHLANEDVRAYYDAQAEASRQLAESQGYIWNGVTNEKAQMDHLAAQRALGTDKPLVNIYLMVLENDLSDLAAKVVDGQINVSAINAGQEVLLYAPDYYEYPSEPADVGPEVLIYNEYIGDGYTFRIGNDTLTTGTVLPLAQFYMTDNTPLYGFYDTQEAYDELYQSVSVNRATVTIGAVLDKNLYSLHDYPFDACLITTEEGLRNMGLNHESLMNAEVYLSGTPDAETEQWLDSRISSIASRGGMTVRNNLAYRREQDAEQQAAIMVFACITLVFFAAAAGLISGNISRQIRADSRMIGTLRAVGADDRALTGCYSGSIFISIGLGTVVACLIIASLIAPGFFGSPADTNFLPAMLSCVVLAALMVGCCLWVLRQRVKDVIKKSIVENIKEL